MRKTRERRDTTPDEKRKMLLIGKREEGKSKVKRYRPSTRV